MKLNDEDFTKKLKRLTELEGHIKVNLSYGDEVAAFNDAIMDEHRSIREEIKIVLEPFLDSIMKAGLLSVDLWQEDKQRYLASCEINGMYENGNLTFICNSENICWQSKGDIEISRETGEVKMEGLNDNKVKPILELSKNKEDLGN